MLRSSRWRQPPCAAVRIRILQSIAVLFVITAIGTAASAYEHNLSIERTFAEILQDKHLQDAKASGDTWGRDVSDEAAGQEGAGKAPTRRAILPDIGYSPETG